PTTLIYTLSYTTLFRSRPLQVHAGLRCALRPGVGHPRPAHRGPGAGGTEDRPQVRGRTGTAGGLPEVRPALARRPARELPAPGGDRKSTRLNSSHVKSS